MQPLLLDTCAIIWLGSGCAMAPEAWDLLEGASRAECAYISPVSAWEIGLLSRPGRDGRPKFGFAPSPKAWFAALLRDRLLRLAPLTIEIAIDASDLPGALHRDPADRMLIATARHLGAALVTRDAAILEYAREGHLDAVPC